MSSVAAFETLRIVDLPVPACVAAHRIIRACNVEFAGLFGHDRETLSGMSFKALYPDLEDFVAIGRRWRRGMAAGLVYSDERIMQDREGRRFWARMDGRALGGEDPLALALYICQPTGRPVPSSGLTPRQAQILTLVAAGRSSPDIARELGLSPRTVEAHRARLMRAAGVANSAALIAWFERMGG
ncbi:helix-turn-helix transcriptional regulator [Devosia enhydra]|nr:LuxR C-terminal-related transcriptional regulator [Devosia enhydra]